MKKMILAAAALAIAGVTTVKANNVTQKQQPIAITSIQDTSKKTPVKLEELPAPVKTTLQTDPVKQWTPTAASLVKTGTAEYYEISVKKGTDERFIRLDKDGKIVQ
jgi:hypothetical protein